MLTKKELIKKLGQNEWDDFEVKKARSSVPKDVWETVSAFANTQGGYIIFGAEEIKGKFKVNGVENPEKIHNDFISTLRSEKFNIPFSAKSAKRVIDGKTVLIFYIPEMPRQAKPIYYSGDIRNTFIRVGGTDQRATKKEIERLLREASESSSDSMIFDDATIEDLRKDTIERFLNLFRSLSQDNKLISLGWKELFIRKGFLKKNKSSRVQITAAAILLFGTDESLARYFPYYKIDYFEVPGTKWGGIGEKRWDYRIPSESNLFETYLMIMPRLKIRVPTPFALKKDSITREELSPALIAIREAFVNLLVHADYFDRKGSSIKVYDNRIELKNGGALLFDESLLKDGDISEPRNPIIIRAYRMVNLAEDAGSGFLKINTNWQKAGFKIPSIESNKRENYFKIVFEFKTRKSHKKSYTDIPSAPSWHQVGTKLALSRDQVKKILNYCTNERPITDVMKIFNWKDRTKFKRKFITPMLEQDLLSMTIPDKPNSPYQKYIITEKGKKLLDELKKEN